MRVSMEITNKGQQKNQCEILQDKDEIKAYLDYNYISSMEACWKIFKFDMYCRELDVESLPFHLENEQTIVFDPTTSRIAAFLLSGGRTTHSCFRIPLDITEESTCDIKKRTQLAKLLAQTALIIWDEAPMANMYYFEALDRTLKDILSKKNQSNIDRIFGGLTVALGGDFRQILPVIPKGKKHDVIEACLSSSSLWKHVTVLTLTENMRLKTTW
ncbi:uncharacterized protein LOC116116952 [Pistacia vera]|uniref:uncharacterized protein LOC116116952 n=1 Tax=Pistacia vera TaxID=55513 RepID=UPI001262C677|nr:uncharacterized protein LOC116116952 [Pistacia vera]